MCVQCGFKSHQDVIEAESATASWMWALAANGLFRYGHRHLPFFWECFLTEKDVSNSIPLRSRWEPLLAAKDALPASRELHPHGWTLQVAGYVQRKALRHIFFPPLDSSRRFPAVPMWFWDHYFGVTDSAHVLYMSWLLIRGFCRHPINT